MIETTAGYLQSAILASVLVSLVACENTETKQKIVVAPMNLNGQIEFSKMALAQRLDVPPDSVKVSSARQVTWRSGALGCPEPGMNYTEALVPGSVIYLQVDNMIHAYHAKFAGEPFYCPRERVESPASEEGVDNT